MPFRNLLLLAFKDFFVRKGRLFLSILGIICGVASLLFILSLIGSVRNTVKNELIGKIPITEMTVKPKERKMGYSLVADYASFNEDLVEYIRTLPNVDAIYPVQSLDFPVEMTGIVRFMGVQIGEFKTATAVFGIPRDVVMDGLRYPERYVFDPDVEEIPIVISRNTLEMFNIGFGKILGYGRFHEDALYGLRFILKFEDPPELKVEYENKLKEAGVSLGEWNCRIIGISNHAPLLGISVPLEYIDYWRDQYWKQNMEALQIALENANWELKNIDDLFFPSFVHWVTYRMQQAYLQEALKKLQKTYEYIIVRAMSIEHVEPIEKTLEDRGLEVRTQKETLDKLNSISFIISLVFGTFGFIILVVSAISIFNILTMSVNEEKVDIGILRSVGARKIHIRLIYILKAGLIGFIGAVDGIVIGFIIMQIGNRILLNYFKNLPFVPKSFFAPTVPLVLICFFIGFFFSVIAGIIPANHAARLKPAVVLRQG